MLYTNFKNKRLSLLGMGGMRFPCHADGTVNETETARIIDLCMENGVNYFDSAWFYHDGASEEVLGKLLRKYPRDSYYLATKLPWSGYTTKEEVQAIFETQLKRAGVDYFDFYLFHNVSENTVDSFENPDFAIPEFLAEQRAKGRIRHLGFSTHGSVKLMEDFIVRHRDILEFCQIQLNWLDFILQDAKAKVELLNRYGLPIWVMEPLRGGKLSALSPEHEAPLHALRPDESIAAWSFRFLESIPGVQMILSGMASCEIATQNFRTFKERLPLSDLERETLLSVAKQLLGKKSLLCTECKYCVSDCPQGLPIPSLLSLYNNTSLLGRAPRKEKVIAKFTEERLPGNCIGCRVCEGKCPQGIKISELLAELAQALR